jgi:hypothetical protein
MVVRSDEHKYSTQLPLRGFEVDRLGCYFVFFFTYCTFAPG